MKKKLQNSFKVIFTLFVVSILFFCAVFWVDSIQDGKKEVKAWARLSQELKDSPEAKLTWDAVDNGERMVTLDIQDKGEVRFWYSEEGVRSIESIKSKMIDFSCFFVDSEGIAQTHAYTTGLQTNDRFRKWLPFDVRTIPELVEHYDDIVAITSAFPKKEELLRTSDVAYRNGYWMPAHPDPNFTLNNTFRGRKVACYLYN